ncbi:MAG: HAMP domain-containing sensor histidine kinase [Actinomycetota bacterium]|nr:HAMP domain-containing sensor histidine kinase [Actinomycetota bacterium]
MKWRRRTTIRFRLTALYAFAFFVCGAIVIGLMYVNVAQNLQHAPGTGVRAAAEKFLDDRGIRNRPVADRVFAAIDEQAAEERADTLRALLVRSVIALGVVGVGAGGLGWLLAGRALNPLQQITETARRVADGSLHERIALEGPLDEIKDLADTFDAMLERLDRAFDGQRRFVANASHELRTPLAINRTLIEVALDDPETPEATRRLGTTLLEVNIRNERLIDSLMLLASSQQHLDLQADIDFAEVVERAIAAASPAAARLKVQLYVQLAPVRVTGDPMLLERLAYNLIDNAVRYNVGEHGWVRVTVAAAPTSARLVVENSGPIVPTSEVNELFEPFRRLRASERLSDAEPASNGRGAGLGLSIVRSVAFAHGGDVHAVAHTAGGLTVTATIPVGR